VSTIRILVHAVSWALLIFTGALGCTVGLLMYTVGTFFGLKFGDV